MAEVTIEAAGANRPSWSNTAADPRNYNPNLLVTICLLVHDFMWLTNCPQFEFYAPYRGDKY